MMMKHLSRADNQKASSYGNIWYLFCAFAVFAIDQLSKHAILSKMNLNETIPLIPGFFHLTFIYNTGASFGILKDNALFFMITNGLIVLFICFVVFFRKWTRRAVKVLLGLITGGALGNLADRLHYGAVVDFLDFRGIWPYIFNAADTAVVCGGILLAIAILLDEKNAGDAKIRGKH